MEDDIGRQSSTTADGIREGGAETIGNTAYARDAGDKRVESVVLRAGP